jgi:translation initiation factor IF-2
VPRGRCLRRARRPDAGGAGLGVRLRAPGHVEPPAPVVPVGRRTAAVAPHRAAVDGAGGRRGAGPAPADPGPRPGLRRPGPGVGGGGGARRPAGRRGGLRWRLRPHGQAAPGPAPPAGRGRAPAGDPVGGGGRGRRAVPGRDLGVVRRARWWTSRTSRTSRRVAGGRSGGGRRGRTTPSGRDHPQGRAVGGGPGPAAGRCRGPVGC